MGKLRANYAFHLYSQAQAAGKSTRRQHSHMHTRKDRGINVDLATDIAANFTWTPPLATQQHDDSLEGPEGITDEDIEEAFAELDQRSADASPLDPVIEGHENDAAKAYDFDELERVNRGFVPTAFEVEVEVVVPTSGNTNWDIQALLLSEGVSSV